MAVEMNTNTLAELKCQLNEATKQAYVAKIGFAAAAIDASIVDPLEVFTRCSDVDGMYWERFSEGLAISAMGSVASFECDGENRFNELSAKWREATGSTTARATVDLKYPQLLGVGVFAFDSYAKVDRVWEPLPRNIWVVPSVVAIRRSGRQSIQCQVVVDDNNGNFEANSNGLALADEILSMDVPQGYKEGKLQHLGVEVEDGLGESWWSESVETVLREIEEERLEKIVLSRRIAITSSRKIDIFRMVTRLRDRFPQGAVFAVRRGNHVFIGASPERLVTVNGRKITSNAVAGTSRPSDAGRKSDGLALVADPKERHEHALVVDSLRSVLSPICENLEVPKEPELLILSNMQHLYTPLTGILDRPLTVMEAVALLHPTPAVGGIPVGTADILLRKLEPFDRGWFAGPVGWMDASGNGEFFVALRSALIESNQAYAYAGCGLVAGSDAKLEWTESELKMDAVLCAL